MDIHIHKHPTYRIRSGREGRDAWMRRILPAEGNIILFPKISQVCFNILPYFHFQIEWLIMVPLFWCKPTVCIALQCVIDLAVVHYDSEKRIGGQTLRSPIIPRLNIQRSTFLEGHRESYIWSVTCWGGAWPWEWFLHLSDPLVHSCQNKLL